MRFTHLVGKGLFRYEIEIWAELIIHDGRSLPRLISVPIYHRFWKEVAHIYGKIYFKQEGEMIKKSYSN